MRVIILIKKIILIVRMITHIGQGDGFWLIAQSPRLELHSSPWENLENHKRAVRFIKIGSTFKDEPDEEKRPL